MHHKAKYIQSAGAKDFLDLLGNSGATWFSKNTPLRRGRCRQSTPLWWRSLATSESDERVVLLLGEDRHEVAAQGVATVLLRGVPAEAVGHEDVLGYNKKQ